MARGRRAALPGPGPGTQRGLLRSDGRTVVRCFEEETGEHRDFDMTGLPVAPDLLAGLAEAFARRTAPGHGPTRIATFAHIDRLLRLFVEYLGTLAWPPREIGHLAPEHLDGFFKHRSGRLVASQNLGEVKLLLAKADGLSDAMLWALAQPGPKRAKFKKCSSYTAGEFNRVAAAARSDLRAAAKRIRDNRALLDQFRSGAIDTSTDSRLAERMRLLEHADQFADVPRYRPERRGGTKGRQVAMNWVFEHGTLDEIVCQLHLSLRELAAAMVLMAVMTGQNRSVLAALPAAHHRADGYAGSTPVVITRARKHRRGRRSHMDLVWSQIPGWIVVPEDPAGISAKDELHTPFGLYMLLHELTARSRALLGVDRLLVSFSTKSGGGKGRGLRVDLADGRIPKFATAHALMADEPDSLGKPIPLDLTLERLRMTYLELGQKPVAHTERTLATTYLLRNRGNLAEYQKVVAEALAEEVDKARVRAAMVTMTAADLARAEQDAEGVAVEYGIDTQILKKMIAGKLDTVMNACVDHENPPNSSPGEPCRASFMQCLECPCARALPRHLPVQLLVHDRLAARRAELDPLTWARRFAGPHARLSDVLDQHGQAAVDDARHQITAEDRNMVERFLRRELDLR